MKFFLLAIFAFANSKKHKTKKDPLDYFPRPDTYKAKFLDNENTVAPKYHALGGLISVDNDAGELADERTYVDPAHL